eukprot:s968_g52.t3
MTSSVSIRFEEESWCDFISHCYQIFFVENEDWTGKMDPYVIVRSGGREFRTPVMTNAGKKPKFNWAQMVDWHGEPDIHFIVMDSNFMVADGLIGEAVYKGLPLHSDFKGQECTESFNRALELIRKHTFGGCRKAGKLKVSIQWQRPDAPGPMPAIHHGHGAHGAHGAHAAHGAGYIPGHPPVGGHDAFGPVSAAMAGQMLLMGAYGPGKKMKKKKDSFACCWIKILRFNRHKTLAQNLNFRKRKKRSSSTRSPSIAVRAPVPAHPDSSCAARDFDEAQLEEVAERLGLPYGAESGDPLDDSGSLGQSGSGGISLPSGDGDKKKKKKKEKKEKKSKEPKKDEGRLEASKLMASCLLLETFLAIAIFVLYAPKTLAPLSTTRSPKLSELPSGPSPQMEEAPPSSESKMSSRVPSQSVLSEEVAEDKEAPPLAPRSSEDLPRPTGGLPPPPSGEPPTVNNSEAKSEGSTKGGSSGSQKEEKTRLEEQFEKSVSALQAEHKAKLAKHRRELQEEFEMERDKTFSELQEKHETQVRAERARLQQELASQKGKTKKELEELLESQEELQRKLNESQAEATRLRSEAASTTRKCSAYEERVARLEEDLKTLRKEATMNKTSDKEVESLKAQVDSKNEEIVRIKAEAAANADRMSKWEEEVHGLRALAGNYDEAKETISKLKKELEERGNANNLQESQELSKSRQDEIESMKATVASTRESLTRELEDKSKLQMELSEARSDLAKASGNKAQLEELRRELGERTKELADAREAIVTASANAAGELDKVKSQLEEEKRTSASTSRSLEEATREVARLEAQINEEESIRSSIKAEAEVESQRKEKEKFQALLDQQSQAARQAEGQLQQELLQEKGARNQLEEQIADLKRQLDIKEASQQELRTEKLEQAQKEIEALKVELCNRTSECAQWRDQAQREDAQSSAAKLKVETLSYSEIYYALGLARSCPHLAGSVFAVVLQAHASADSRCFKMDCATRADGADAITVVLPDHTSVTLPHEVLSLSPMLSSLEGLFLDGEAFQVPLSAGLTKRGLSSLSEFIGNCRGSDAAVHSKLPNQWPSTEAAEFLRAASFFDVQNAVEAAAETMAARLLDCESEAEVHSLGAAKESNDAQSDILLTDAEDVQKLTALCPTLGLRGLAFARLACAGDGLLPKFSMDFLGTVLEKAESEASEAPEIHQLRRVLSRFGRGSLRRKILALEDVACEKNRGSSTIIALVLAYSADQEPEVRSNCLETLSELVPKEMYGNSLNESISAAVNLLCDASLKVREAAVDALLSWSPLEPWAILKLEQLMRQKSGLVKAAAVEAMAGSVEAMPETRTLLLLSCLEDMNKNVQSAAAMVFGRYAKHSLSVGDVEVVINLADAISDKLQSRREWVKCAAAASLQKVLQHFDQPHLKAKSSLLAAFADSSSAVRCSVAHALPYVSQDDFEVRQTLVTALQDSQPAVWSTARDALVMIANKSNWQGLVQKLLELIDSGVSQTRCVVLETLHAILRRPHCDPTDLGSSESFTSLMTNSLCPRLMDTDGYVRIAAARTIGRLTATVLGKSEDFADLLATVAAEDDDDDVKAAALEALTTSAEVGDLKATRVAVEASKHKSTEVRRQALAVLCALIPFAPDQIDSVLSAVCARISDSNDHIRRFAMEALPEVIQGYDSAGVTAVRALGAVARRRSSSDQMAVCALESIACVARLGGPKTRASALSPVAACLKDENWIVREAAENAACTMNITMPDVCSRLRVAVLLTLARWFDAACLKDRALGMHAHPVCGCAAHALLASDLLAGSCSCAAHTPLANALLGGCQKITPPSCGPKISQHDEREICPSAKLCTKFGHFVSCVNFIAILRAVVLGHGKARKRVGFFFSRKGAWIEAARGGAWIEAAKHVGFFSARDGARIETGKPVGFFAECDGVWLEAGKRVSFFSARDGAWIETGKPVGFFSACDGAWIEAGKRVGFFSARDGAWIETGKPGGFFSACDGAWIEAGKHVGFFSARDGALIETGKPGGFFSECDGVWIEGGKPVSFFFARDGAWIETGKPFGFFSECDGVWLEAGKPVSFFFARDGAWIETGKPVGFFSACDGAWIATSRVATLKAELETWRAECGRLSQASQTELPKMQALLEEEKVAASRAKAEAIEGMAQIKAQAAATAAELEARSKECGRLRAEVQACRPNGKLSQDEVRELVALRAKVLELETEAEALRQAQSITNPDEQKVRSMVKDRDDTILRLRAVVTSRFAQGKVAMAPPQVQSQV